MILQYLLHLLPAHSLSITMKISPEIVLDFQNIFHSLHIVIYLIYNGFLQIQTDGTTKIMDFFDEQRMCRLYGKIFLLSLKNNTWRYWKLPERNTRTFQQTLIIEKDIIYSWEWRNTCGIICYFCMISEYLLLITKRNGFCGIISGNRRRPWHLGVSKVLIISVNAWPCLFWCGWKNKITLCTWFHPREAFFITGISRNDFLITQKCSQKSAVLSIISNCIWSFTFYNFIEIYHYFTG